MTDPDYSREDTPRADSGLPVNRTRILTADRVITAVLRNQIVSQNPGLIDAIVDANVYGADNREILIPKGSIVLGRYQSLSKQGDSRLDVAWYRIIRPDGAHILMGDDDPFIAQDLVGSTGLIGDVDNRIWDRYGAAAVTTLLSAVASTAVSGSSSSGVSNAGNAMSLQLAQVTAKVLDQQINLAPIITVPAGSLINIRPTRDVFLREPIYPHDQEEAQPKSKDGKKP